MIVIKLFFLLCWVNLCFFASVFPCVCFFPWKMVIGYFADLWCAGLIYVDATLSHSEHHILIKHGGGYCLSCFLL